MIKTIFSIEDDTTTQFLNRYIIEAEAFCENMIEAYNGVEAITYYEKLEKGEIPKENLPEIILLDLNMPVMDGWEFFETFKKRFPTYFSKTKIFILSSSINPIDEAKAKNEKNIKAFLQKPLDKDKIEVIRKIMNKDNL